MDFATGLAVGMSLGWGGGYALGHSFGNRNDECDYDELIAIAEKILAAYNRDKHHDTLALREAMLELQKYMEASCQE